MAGTASGRPGSGAKGEPPGPVQTPLVGFSANISEPLIHKVGGTSPQRQPSLGLWERALLRLPVTSGAERRLGPQDRVAREVRLDAGGPRVPGVHSHGPELTWSPCRSEIKSGSLPPSCERKLDPRACVRACEWGDNRHHLPAGPRTGLECGQLKARRRGLMRPSVPVEGVLPPSVADGVSPTVPLRWALQGRKPVPIPAPPRRREAAAPDPSPVPGGGQWPAPGVLRPRVDRRPAF